MEKLKVFISGTQDDMQLERDAVSRAVDAVALATGIRAEKTLSRPQSPREWILEQIRACNIYLGIYSHHYGWIIPEENISATEFEFKKARQLRKPILVWIRELRDEERNLPGFERQQQFLKRVSDFSEGYVRQEFENLNDLEQWVSAALRETFVEIIERETTRPISYPELPDAALVRTYLEEVAKQRPYVLWSDQSPYLDRTVSRTEDLFARTVAYYDPRMPEWKEKHKTEPLEEALARESKLVLLGEPGLGKTTSLVHLAWEVASRASANLPECSEPAGGSPEIPIYIELKYYSGEAELETLLARRVNEILRPRSLAIASDLAESTRILKAWLAQSDARFLLLLDGLNEVRPEFYTLVRGVLEVLMNAPHRIIVACRERDYEGSLRDRASAFVLQGLQDKDIQDYLRRVLGSKGVELFEEQIIGDLWTLAANPLMLWLIGVAAQGDPEARLPANRGKLFQQFATQMPLLRAREGIRAEMPSDVVITVLARLGFEMQERDLLAVDLGEVRSWQISAAGKQLEDVLVQAKDWRFLKSDGRLGEPVEFLHQLFLEYFAAEYLSAELRRDKDYTRVLGQRAYGSSWWRWEEVIVMLAGITDRSADLVKWLCTDAQVPAVTRGKFMDLALRCWETSEALNDVEARDYLVDSLIVALHDSTPDAFSHYKVKEVREHAAWALALIGAPAVKRLLAALRDTDAWVRQSVASVLGEIRDPQAVGPLIISLRDPVEGVREHAAWALGEIGTPAIEPLLAALRNEAVTMRRGAIKALGKICDPCTVQPLILALRDADDGVRRGAPDVLGEIGDELAVEPLILALQDPAADVRSGAAHALGKLHDLRAVEPLIHALQDPAADVRSGAAIALGELRDLCAVEPLITKLQDRDENVRWSTAWALGKIGDPRAVEPLIATCADPSRFVRWYVVLALGQTGDSRALLELERIAGDDIDISVAHTAWEAFEEIRQRMESGLSANS